MFPNVLKSHRTIPTYTLTQTAALVFLRVLIGWHFLYEGIVKLINENWTSAGYLVESKWILSDFFMWIVGHQMILKLIDLMNIWGLIAIGLGLMVGCLARLAGVAGILLLLLYFVANPPFIGYSYSMPSEGSYLIVNKNLIEACALFVLVLFPTSSIIGVDRLIFVKK